MYSLSCSGTGILKKTCMCCHGIWSLEMKSLSYTNAGVSSS